MWAQIKGGGSDVFLKALGDDWGKCYRAKVIEAGCGDFWGTGMMVADFKSVWDDCLVPVTCCKFW